MKKKKIKKMIKSYEAEIASNIDDIKNYDLTPEQIIKSGKGIEYYQMQIGRLQLMLKCC